MKERDEAVMRRRLKQEVEAAAEKLPPGEQITRGEYADEYLARMEDGRLRPKCDDSERRYKSSSIGTARTQLRRFTAEFGARALVDLTKGRGGVV